jgi:hypothetical protein
MVVRHFRNLQLHSAHVPSKAAALGHDGRCADDPPGRQLLLQALFSTSAERAMPLWLMGV